MMIRTLSAVALIFTPLLLLSHSGGHPTRFVANGGVDIGECSDPKAPCKSIGYAVGRSTKGDEVVVASGKYVVDELDVFYLLSDIVMVKGGFSTKDSFAKQEADKHRTVIEGVPFEYRERLYAHGFQLLQDSKGLETKLTLKNKTQLARYEKLTTESSKMMECSNGQAGSNPCHNMDLISHTPLSQMTGRPSGANDIWGFVSLNDQREYALVGVKTGTAVFDVTDAQNPTQVGHVSGTVSDWRDIKTYQYFDDQTQSYLAYAYVTSEESGGLQIIDLNSLPQSVSLAATISSGFTTAHNVYVANIDYASGLVNDGFEPFLYISGANTNGGGFLTYNLSNPIAPSLVARGDRGYVHDLTSFTITDSRTDQCDDNHNPCEIIVDFNENTIDIWDVTDKSDLFLISSSSYQNVGYVHSGWWSEDKMTVFVQDELDEQRFGLNTTLRALDISNLASPSLAGTYVGQTKAIDHNGFTVGNYYYMSNYRRGLTVIDVSTPSAMKEVAYFDTFASPEANTADFNGAWGVYPFLPSGNLLVSDINYGLWIVKLNENDGPLPIIESEGKGGGGGSTGHFWLILLALFSARKIRALNTKH